MNPSFGNGRQESPEAYDGVEREDRRLDEDRLGEQNRAFRFTGVLTEPVTPPPPPPPPYYAAINPDSLFSHQPAVESNGNNISEKYGISYSNDANVNSSIPDNLMEVYLMNRQLPAANQRMYPQPQAIPPMQTNHLNVLQPIDSYEANNQTTQRLPQRSPNQCQPNGHQPAGGTKKQKRPRTAYTSTQLLSLETAFQKEKYLNRSGRINISRELQLTEKQVKVWFQNRRMKYKKENKNASPEHRSDTSSGSAPTPSPPPRPLRLRSRNQNPPSTSAGAGNVSPQYYGNTAAPTSQYQLPPPYPSIESSWQYQYQMPQQPQFPQYQYQPCQYPNNMPNGVPLWSSGMANLEIGGSGHETSPVQDMHMSNFTSNAQPIGVLSETSTIHQPDISYQQQLSMLNGENDQILMNGVNNETQENGESSRQEYKYNSDLTEL